MSRARYRRIVFFFARLIASFVLWDLILSRLGMRAIARRTRPERMRAAARRFRLLAIGMGGVMIKVGQFLSARVDVLPQVITDELAGLQDEVPPEDYADIRRVAESELGAPLVTRFEFFDETPLAAASLGQVHRARLRVPAPDEESLTAVVVKVQRPNI